MSSFNYYIFLLFVSLVFNSISADEPQYRSYYYIELNLNISKNGDSKLLRRPIYQILPISVINTPRFETVGGILTHSISNLCNNISTPILHQGSSTVLFIRLFVPTQVSEHALYVFYRFNFL